MAEILIINSERSQKNYADAEGLLYRQNCKLLRLIVPQVHKSVCLKKYVANSSWFLNVNWYTSD